MAKEAGLSQTAVPRIWRAFGLKPHLVDTWKLSADPMFVEKVRDVVGPYLDPPVKAMVLCVDEKSQMQALERTRPMLPMMPTVSARQTHAHDRVGGCDADAFGEFAHGHLPLGEHDVDGERHRITSFSSACISAAAASRASLGGAPAAL